MSQNHQDLRGYGQDRQIIDQLYGPPEEIFESKPLISQVNNYQGISDVRQEQGQRLPSDFTSQNIANWGSVFGIEPNKVQQGNIQGMSNSNQSQDIQLISLGNLSMIHSNQISQLIGIRQEIMRSNPNMLVNHQDDWDINTYSQNTEQYQKVINEHLEYLKELENKRQNQIYQLQFKQNEILSIKQQILQQQHTGSLQIFFSEICPKADELQQLLRQFQNIMDTFTKVLIIPFNPFNKFQGKISDISMSDDLLKYLIKELETHQYNLNQHITNIRQFQLTQQISDSYQQEVKSYLGCFNIVTDFLQQQLTQKVYNIQVQNELETQKILHNIKTTMDSQNIDGIKYFFGKLLQVKGLVKDFKDIRDQKFRYILQKLTEEQQQITNLQEFVDKLKKYQIQIEQVKQNLKNIEIQDVIPFFQILQRKMKAKNFQLQKQILQEIKVLIDEGQILIQIQNQVPQYENQRILTEKLFEEFKNIVMDRTQFQNLSNSNVQSRVFDQKIVKKALVKLQLNYQQLEFIYSDLHNINKITSFGYKEYYNKNLKHKFNYKLNWPQIIHDYINLFTIQNEDKDVLIHVKSLLNYQWPQFNWENTIKIEQTKQNNLNGRYVLINETLQKYKNQNYDPNLKFMRQLTIFSNDLLKSLHIVQQYLNTREYFENQVDSLLTINDQNLPLIEDNLLVLNNLINQTNQQINQINQLKQNNPFWRLKQILTISQDKIDFQSVKQNILQIQQSYKRQQYQYQQSIQEEINIIDQFIIVSLKHFEKDIENLFRNTKTYQELEEYFSGKAEFQKLLQQYNDHYEIRQNLSNFFTQFFNTKASIEFQQLFQLLLLQSNQGNNRLDPNLLAIRTDLLFDIEREDMNNHYVQQEMETIRIILQQDNKELRQLFKDAKNLFNQIMNELLQMDNEYDFKNGQNTIMYSIENFQQKQQHDNAINNIESLSNFHQLLINWHQGMKIINPLINLGIILKFEYQQYLSIVRRTLLQLQEGVIIVIDSLDPQLIDSVKITIDNDQGMTLKEIEANYQYYYCDVQSIILKKQRMRITINQLENVHVFVDNQELYQASIEIQ